MVKSPVFVVILFQRFSECNNIFFFLSFGKMWRAFGWDMSFKNHQSNILFYKSPLEQMNS